MNKYIKLEDAIEAYNQAVTLLVESEMEEFNLGDFTECSFNTTQIKLIARMIESLPTIEVSEDAISRKWVLSEITTKVEDDDSLTNEQKDSLSAAKYLVRHAPPVVPQPKEGKWIIHKINGIPHTVECSHCHQHYDYEELRHLGCSKGCIDIPHCPNCGAKMKKKDEV